MLPWKPILMLWILSPFVSLEGLNADLNVQIQALNQVLDALDHQLDNIVEEIIRIRIPEASYAVLRERKRANNLWIFTAILSAGGQFLRILHNNWDVQDDISSNEFYKQMLSTAATASGGSSYAFTRLVRVKPFDIDCGLHSFYHVQEKYFTLFHLSKVYDFIPRVSSEYFIQNPLKYLDNYTIPKVLQIKTSLFGIKLKNELSCLLEDLEPSSDLLRAIDLLVKTMKKRLQNTDKILRLIIKRNEMSEPVQYLWYSD